MPASTSINLQIQERSRSVKAIFAVVRRAPAIISADSGALHHVTSASTLQNFQFRIGGRYFPASPVQCSYSFGSNLSNGAAEAYLELQKALNTVGDYRLSSTVNCNRWATPYATGNFAGLAAAITTSIAESDYSCSLTTRAASTGVPVARAIEMPLAGLQGSCAFAMATDLETSNGMEISGLNAEEQSDISLMATYSAAQSAGYNIEVFTYFDAMLILRENNVLELIQ